MGKIVRLLQVLGVNAVPAFGVFAADWTAATALALYWCENILVTLLVGARLWLHRSKTSKRGHWQAQSSSGSGKSSGGTFLSNFLGMALFFSAGHAVFLAVILFVVIPNEFPESGGVELRSLLLGVATVSVFLVMGFLYDTIGIESRSFAWVKHLSDRVVGRVVVVHLTIIFGMAAMSWLGGPYGLFLVFAGFKTLSDLSAMTGSGHRPPEQPAEKPSGWLLSLIRKLGGKAKAEDFARHYHSTLGDWKEAQWEKRREDQ